ncbi:ATP-binding cassette sub-family A member 3, partial [Nephila pilipes]
MQFVYAPGNPTTDKFMQEAIKLFKTRTGYVGNITSKGTKNEKELASYCLYQQRDDSRSNMIGTVFKDFENKVPVSLDYKIRYSSVYYSTNFFTQLKYRVNGPKYGTAYTDTYFLNWQAAVEQTFIERKMEEYNKTDFSYKVWMQRFPYPEHRDTSSGFSVINIVPWVIGYGYLIFIINIVRRMIEEKANGSKELLKMMGMTDFTYWASTFMNYFIIGLITLLIITIVYKAPLKHGIVFLKNSDFFLVYILLCLFMASLILFCMLFSIFFNRTIFAVIALLVVYVMSLTFLLIKLFMLESDLNYLPLSVGNKFGICLLPPGALNTLFFFASFYEASGEGLQWYNITEFSLVPDYNVLMVIGAMSFSCLLFIFGIWYFDAVWPWQPGVPKPFYFLFLPSYWFGANSKSGAEMKLVNKSDNNVDFFEEEPSGTSPGVIIKNLCK